MSVTAPQDEKLLEEVADMADHEGMDIRMVTALAGDRTLNAREEKVLEQLRKDQGEALYANLLYALTRRTFPDRQARQLWQDILTHRATLKTTLQRDVGIVVAAHDYLTNITRLLRNVCLIEEDKLARLASVATRDGLTGLVDQATFKLQLKEELERVKRYGGQVSLVMLDLDHFKKVNDKFGHAEGDIVLEQTADIIREEIRALDIAARYGGEEFAIILPETDPKAAAALAERLRKAVENHFAGNAYKVTTSAGVATFIENTADDAETFAKRADDALYAAKKAGRNQVCVASASK